MARFPFPPKARNPFPPGMRPGPAYPAKSENAQFSSLRASLLYCPSCKTATPARERLLLVLPNGNLYEYLCAHCGTSTGEKTDQETQDVRLFIP